MCFFVTREYRGRGITARLTDAAVEHAREHGATVIEAYPVDPDSPSHRFMGFVDALDSNFCKAFWILPLAWAIHEAEAWNILAWSNRYWVNVSHF